MSLVRCVGNIFNTRGNWNVVGFFCSRSDRFPSVGYDQKAQASSFKDLLAVDRGYAVVRWVLSLKKTRPTLLLRGATLESPQTHVTWLSNALFAVLPESFAVMGGLTTPSERSLSDVFDRRTDWSLCRGISAETAILHVPSPVDLWLLLCI
jgi:hypothetical protein